MSKKITFKKYQTRSPDYHWQQIRPNIFYFNAFVAARYQQVVDQIPTNKNLKILDIGCGDGVLLWLISQKTPAKLFGIDTDKSSLKLARSKLGDKATLKQASAYQLPFKARQFDIVIATEVIEHLNQPSRMLQEIKRALKPSGRLIISTPIKLTSIPEDKMHVKEFTPKELKTCLKKYFSSVALKTSHPLWLKKLYLICLFKLGRYHLEPFRWLINLWVILTKLNPFLLSSKKDTNQIAICRQPL
jgi:2-polyprenyl-3-methyl-5-hydroxy-6-metoxy-1,4-benzoquinol methylase